MVMDIARLRTAVFERTGIAVDEKDPIMAVLVVAAEQTEEIGERLLARTGPARVAAVTAVAASAFALVGGWVGLHIGRGHLEQARVEWLQVQADPGRAALLASGEGRAALRLAELGVAELLANCSGRPSWRIRNGYCIPATPRGTPDGFRVKESK